jgi:hypothetical protein
LGFQARHFYIFQELAGAYRLPTLSSELMITEADEFGSFLLPFIIVQVWTDAASSSSSTGSSSNSNSNNNGRDTINGQHKSSQAPPPAAGDDNNDEKSHAQGRYGASLMEKTSVLVVGLSYLVAVLAAMYL